VNRNNHIKELKGEFFLKRKLQINPQRGNKEYNTTQAAPTPIFFSFFESRRN
jgi:hypothetical protein